MIFITLILVAVSFKSLEAIIIDANYMPSAPKQQVDTAPLRKVPRLREPAVRERQNEVDYVEEYPTVKPLYKYGYSVFDPYTLDIKSQWEHRDGDFVRGAYNMLEADGSLRIVEYTSDKDNGFRAIVKKIPFFLEQSRRQVETVPRYTSRTSPVTRNENNNINNIQPESPSPVPIVYHPDPTASYHLRQNEVPTSNFNQHQNELPTANYHQRQNELPAANYNQRQNELNSQQYNRQSENYIQQGNFYKQQLYHSKQKQATSAPTLPVDVYKRLLPTL